ncbi:MAG TPA: prepilin-type N-terminal cleavage/methylation domain-containing protein [Steroidobacteraceae bacterium]|jgi:prepilin-type N-terminal cleavage/methylation domain-containing protein
MRAPSYAYRGFTLIELIAAITIVAILAAVSLPKLTAATPFQQRGYADVVAASLRQARATAIASSCDVQFTINGLGFRALQRAASGTHCASAGAFVTPLLDGLPPRGVVPSASRIVVFRGATGALTGATTTINLGPQVITIDASGTVFGP